MTAQERPQPAPGPRRSLTSAPPVPAGGWRRLTAIDSHRPDGLGGPVVVELTGADVPGGETVSMRAVIESGVLVDAPAPVPGLAGARVGGGFRKLLADALGPDRACTLVHRLLDDLVGASLVAGYALLHAGALGHDGAVASMRANTGLCAGWAAEGGMMRTMAATGQVPVPGGAPAPELDDHPGLAPLPAGSMRRRRRLDVGPDGGLEAHFRDSHVPTAGGPEQVLHEYVVRARVADGVFVDAHAEALVLPWAECPGSLASAARLVGVALADVDTVVRSSCTGTSSCTHLNDTLRTLADAAHRPNRV